MKLLPIFRKFRLGEITPRLWGQSDTDVYKSGLAECTNMLPVRHGPVIRRNGLKYIDNLDTETSARIFGFHFRANIQFMVVVDTTNITISDAANFIVTIPCSVVDADPLLTTFAYSAADLEELQAHFNPNNMELWLTCSGVTPQKIILTLPLPGTWTLQQIQFIYQDAAMVDLPLPWGPGTFPTTMDWYQERAYFAGLGEFPDRFLASKTNGYDVPRIPPLAGYTAVDLSQGTTAEFGLDYFLARFGQIQWISGIRNIIMGTSSAEYIITSESGNLTPVDGIRAEMQSAYGSSDITQNLDVGNQTLYVTPDAIKLRTVGFQWTDESWVSNDMSFTAEHFKQYGRMTHTAFETNPEQIIWMVTDQGVLLSCSYDPETKTLGWAKHFTEGTFLDVAEIQEDGVSQVYVLVERDLDGTPTIFLEVFIPSLAVDVPAGAGVTTIIGFQDSITIIASTPDNTAITGVTHLANKTVQVTVDGAAVPDVTLDASGDGTSTVAGTLIVVGYPFTAKMVTLPLDQPTKAGSAMSQKKRWNRIFVRLIASANPTINGIRPPSRTPQAPMDVRQPLSTDDVEVRDTGWDQFAQITIEQDLALPLEVVAIFGEANENFMG